MQLIGHRINTLSQLQALPKDYGAEIDIRTYNNRLILHHDPFKEGECFKTWLDHYEHQTLILNVKEEGLENAVLELLNERDIDDFFFLDQSIPFLLKTAKQGETRCAIRWSEFETLDTVLNFVKLIDWLWIDCFSTFPFAQDNIDIIKTLPIRTCLVSPELQGRHDKKEIMDTLKKMRTLDFRPDAICTKKPEVWK